MDEEQSKKLHIPYPTGPYATGCMELMTEYSEEGCFARVFYPTNIPSDQLDKYSDKWVPWMPNEMYLKAFANSLRLPYFIFKYFPPIIGQAPYYIPTISDAPLSDKEQSYPFVIFSHGYAATRFVCSEFCNTLASHGFIVAAIEHRDKSSPLTYYYDSPESAEQDKPTWVKYRHFHKTYNTDNYLLKNSQLKVRHRECTKLLNTFLDLNAGGSVKNVLKSSFDLNQFNGKINVNKIITSGFSFGGATAMYNACYDSRYHVAIIIDGWMFPLKSEPFLNIQQPILFINTHTFHIAVNLRLIRQYFCSKGIRKLYTIKNTTHESPTDTPFIHGYWLDLQMLKKLDAKTALNLQSSLVVQFLRDTIGCPTNSDSAQIFIKEHSDDLVEDVILYQKRIIRKIGIYPW
ncbi:phospholipase A2, group VII [Acyrthosiphon pisum]|uniref:1-alkyl-2-acetylglycerophosphocholine esterase n=1 Tax=Acyrthosiphon pisum TaxID=7029 RepID=C4WXW2_ACYPI|nr:phospholipase A2, group VII [Acyrthosiphon pisum]BAH72732.1 ACYPI001545 [Acyrthosiphon pisum]|eukprot:NP_001156431.1 phospholipase A2, group VII [Acyrthosiphon pisum]